MMKSLDLPSVGTRLSYSGHLGTIRFVGPVENTSGIWLGIEWDDPRRGKHDGVKDGKRYFSCLVPSSGSFIRISSAISYGKSFLTALVSKYVEELHGASSLETVVLGSSGGAIEVEAVGLDKIRGRLAHLERLREISLDNEGVSSIDPPGAIEHTCPGIRGLDLSKNLIPTWDIVAMIVSELPCLQRLALNQNRLRPASDFNPLASAFRRLRELQLNATLTTWTELEHVISYMPNLQILEMGYNRLKSLAASDRNSGVRSNNSTIEEVNLDSNELPDWSAVCRALKPYTALQRLVLTSNHIENIDIVKNASVPLIHLKHLSLSFNRLKTWHDIDVIPIWCPELQSLTLAGNPVVEDVELGRNARQFIIAKIPTLVSLDAAAITTKERVDSELFYLSYVNKHTPPGEEAKCLEHPQWKALCIKHGRPDSAPSTGQARQDTLSNRLIQINVYECFEVPTANIDLQLAGNSAPVPLRVLPTMSIRTFRAKVTKSFKISKPDQTAVRLWLQLPDGHVAEMDRDNEARDLAWWGLEDGSNMILFLDKAQII
ncbi:hypothetical protein AcW1_006039 [Taiwanofungus camphoratus]|nr:hypothetical protein AcW1_006039 [Antrodia cinnamomea]